MHPSDFAQTYVKTYQDFFGYFKMELNEALMSLVDQFDGLLLGVPIHYPYHSKGEDQANEPTHYKLRFYKDLDFREVIPILISTLDIKQYELVCRTRDYLMMARGNLYLTVSFELFPSLISVTKSEDWAHPYAYYLKGNVYYSPYTRVCLRDDIIHWCILTRDLAYEPITHWLTGDVFTEPSMQLGVPGCQFCPLSDTSPLRILWDDSTYSGDYWGSYPEDKEMIRKIAQGVPGAKLEHMLNPLVWDQEYLVLDTNQLCALGLKNNDVPLAEAYNDPRGIMERKARTHLGMRNLVNARLPLGFCAPTPYMNKLCQDCLALFKPVWSWEYASLYKNELIKLYLILSKHGMYWDLVIHTFSILTCLRMTDRTLSLIERPGNSGQFLSTY